MSKQYQCKLSMHCESLPMTVPFRIAGHVFEAISVLVVTLMSNGQRGRGEAAGVYYLNDTPDGMASIVESIRSEIEAGLSRDDLRHLLPPSGARNAIDCAMWEMESHCQGLPVWRLAGLSGSRSLLTTITIGADAPEVMAEMAKKLSTAAAIKLKLTGDCVKDIQRIRAVRAARPDVWLGVDANQGYQISTIAPLIPVLIESDIKLIEQPFARGREEDMALVDFVIPTAADESCLSLEELERTSRYFDVVNIKLDKCGGLTEGLLMCRQARVLGMKVMVGNMGGSSVAMGPAFVLGQLCDLVDLDGPIFLNNDRNPAMQYFDGRIVDPGGVWGCKNSLVEFQGRNGPFRL